MVSVKYHEFGIKSSAPFFSNKILSTPSPIPLYSSTVITPLSFYVLVYVDDILVTGNHSHCLQNSINTLSSKFILKDLGSLNYFLGMKVTPTSQGLFISQHKYITDILSKTNMFEANSVTTPLSNRDPLQFHYGTPKTDATTFRTILGSLQYLSLT